MAEVTPDAAAERPGTRRIDRPWFPLFDGFRAVAALAVLVQHVAFVAGFQIVNQPGSDDAVHPAAAYVARLDIGVALFFLISGFLLYRPFVAAHLAGTAPQPLRAYFRRRWLRILPAYWVALTVVLVFFHRDDVDSIGDAVIYYGLLQIYSSDHVLGGIQQAWTLCTEESFYLFLPVYAWALRAVGRRVGRLGAELGGVAVLFAGGIAYQAAMLHLVDDERFTIRQEWLPGMANLFALGMLLAVMSAWLPHAARQPKPVVFLARHPGVSWLLAALCFWIVSTRLGLPRALGPFTAPQIILRQLFYGLTAFFFLVPGVFGPQDVGLVRKLMRWRPIALVGVVTYGVYLWHELMIDKYLEWRDIGVFEAETTGEFLVMAAAVAGLSIAVATISYLLVERPMRRFRDRPLLRRRPA